MTGEGWILGGLFVVQRGGAIEYESPELTFGDAAPLDEVFEAAASASSKAGPEPEPETQPELEPAASGSWFGPGGADQELPPVDDLDWLDDSATAWTQDASLAPPVVPEPELCGDSPSTSAPPPV